MNKAMIQDARYGLAAANTLRGEMQQEIGQLLFLEKTNKYPDSLGDRLDDLLSQYEQLDKTLTWMYQIIDDIAKSFIAFDERVG